MTITATIQRINEGTPFIKLTQEEKWDFSYIFSSCPNKITHLSLDGTHIHSEEKAIRIGRRINRLPNLTHLSLSHCNLSKENAWLLFREHVLPKGTSNLVEINLSFNNFSPDEVTVFNILDPYGERRYNKSLAFSKAFPNLQRALFLPGNTQGAAIRLEASRIEALDQNTLQKLNHSFPIAKFPPEEKARLKRALVRLKTEVTTLNLNSYSFSLNTHPKLVQALINTISCLPNLRTLCIWNDASTEEDLSHIFFEVFKENKALLLEKIDIRGKKTLLTHAQLKRVIDPLENVFGPSGKDYTKTSPLSRSFSCLKTVCYTNEKGKGLILKSAAT